MKSTLEKGAFLFDGSLNYFNQIFQFNGNIFFIFVQIFIR